MSFADTRAPRSRPGRTVGALHARARCYYERGKSHEPGADFYWASQIFSQFPPYVRKKQAGQLAPRHPRCYDVVIVDFGAPGGFIVPRLPQVVRRPSKRRLTGETLPSPVFFPSPRPWNFLAATRSSPCPGTPRPVREPYAEPRDPARGHTEFDAQDGAMTTTPWPHPRILAHRGGGSLAPENTLAGIRKASSMVFGAVAFDVVLSADAVPVLIHDETLVRTTNGRGAVAGVP